jgi:hypothetical protein
MPLYVYRCPKCNAQREIQRKIAERDEPVMCSHGDPLLLPLNGSDIHATPMERIPTAPLGGFPGADDWRR